MPASELVRHFQMLGRYNTIANQRLYEACSKLDENEYRKPRPGSLGSIHALLNHILLGDRIWLGRFEKDMEKTPPLATILYDDFAALRQARQAEDMRLETFLGGLSDGFFSRQIRYVNSAGAVCTDPAELLLAHLFNHQTHHRGQVHVMLSQTSVPPPSLDMHRALRPVDTQTVIAG